jgi:5'(3')-deoxyribonucleotidase
MSHKYIFGVDADDVLIDLVPQWVKTYNYFYNRNLKAEDILEWDIKKFINPKDDIFMILKKYHDYNLCSLIPDALDGFNFLRNLGHKVIVITSTPKEHLGVKLEFLNSRGFNIQDRDYFETSNKDEVDKDYLLDDNPKTISETISNGIIFTRNWNKSLDWKYRANGWKDFISKWKRGLYGNEY